MHDPVPTREGLSAFSALVRVKICGMLDANFYEKALFVKPTWRLCIVVEANGFLCPS
jgi:hypothetical protein